MNSNTFTIPAHPPPSHMQRVVETTGPRCRGNPVGRVFFDFGARDHNLDNRGVRGEAYTHVTATRLPAARQNRLTVVTGHAVPAVSAVKVLSVRHVIHCDRLIHLGYRTGHCDLLYESLPCLNGDW